MPKSLIMLTAARYLLPLLFLFSLFILFRGHNEPGGGFIGGLVAAAAFALYAIAITPEAARRALRLEPRRLLTLGVLIALLSGLGGPLVGLPFMTGLWWDVTLPFVGKPGTVILFDVGVYLTVVGVVLVIIFSLAED